VPLPPAQAKFGAAQAVRVPVLVAVAVGLWVSMRANWALVQAPASASSAIEGPEVRETVMGAHAYPPRSHAQPKDDKSLEWLASRARPRHNGDVSLSALGFPHLFGPVASRRLGRSLGIDLLPYKTCSLDCVYCECGATTNLTSERAEFVSADQVMAELDTYLAKKPDLDYVTFSGSGEPTLHTGLGRIIAHIKAKHPRYRVAVLSNGTLFSRPEVRQQVLQADLLVPSLDGATPESFQAIDRPAPGISVSDVIAGLTALRDEYRGTYVLEVFIVPGVNDTNREMVALRGAAELIRPDAIQLNRLDRPGADAVAVASDELLNMLAQSLEPFPVFVVPSRKSGETRRLDDRQVEQAIQSRLAERTYDVTTLAFLIGLQEGVVAKCVRHMLDDGRLARVDSPVPNRIIVRQARR
jgi:wyosine [tRNA(Phe)-imidazoG37] synthetase (radical SAM superfamily)